MPADARDSKAITETLKETRIIATDQIPSLGLDVHGSSQAQGASEVKLDCMLLKPVHLSY